MFGPDQRRVIVVAIVSLAVMASAFLGFSHLIRPKTEFEREQARAVMRNPRWLEIEIGTSDGRREYRETEAILLVVRFSSAAPHMYKADAADGASISAASDELHISNGEKRPLSTMGIVCCDSRLVGLDDEPFARRPRTPLKLSPGEYEIYLTSRRVFNWDGNGILTCCGPSPFEVSSNMLKIRVLPDSDGSPRRFPIPFNR
jgi:hypothetical protein